MTAQDLKALKRLADMCRKSGIKHFKSEQFEFTLSDEAPISNYKKKAEMKAPALEGPSKPFETDSLSDNELLFWSTGNPADTIQETGE